MGRDLERIRRVQAALQEARLDGIICTAPINVLLLSGYWPVVGTALAITTREGAFLVLAPEDEQEIARQTGGADEIATFEAGSLKSLRATREVVAEALAQAAEKLGLRQGRIGYEAGALSEPASYAGMYLYGADRLPLLQQVWPDATFAPADDLLTRQRSVKTPQEIARIRLAARIAERAFAEGAQQLAPGLKETEAAARFRAPLSTLGVGCEGVERADGFAFCMSGPNAEQAYAAYQRSRSRPIQCGEFVLIHVNSYADGFWTDVTRTYCLGDANARMQTLYAAIFAARQAALDAIRPGARAADIDHAARDTLAARGFGEAFKHPTGHGVGFAAIDHNALPRLHPLSPDVLETGMVFNVEPGLYFEGEGGLRHCDMVAVTEGGCELLTPFHAGMDALRLSDHP